MIRAAIITAALLLASPASAQSDMPEAPNASDSICNVVGKFAWMIMDLRQLGATFAEAMRIAEKTEEPELRKALIRLTVEAYEHPKFATPRYQAQAAREFSSQQELACHKAVNP